jgi:hypothetical protein
MSGSNVHLYAHLIHRISVWLQRGAPKPEQSFVCDNFAPSAEPAQGKSPNSPEIPQHRRSTDRDAGKPVKVIAEDWLPPWIPLGPGAPVRNICE